MVNVEVICKFNESMDYYYYKDLEGDLFIPKIHSLENINIHLNNIKKITLSLTDNPLIQLDTPQGKKDYSVTIQQVNELFGIAFSAYINKTDDEIDIEMENIATSIVHLTQSIRELQVTQIKLKVKCGDDLFVIKERIDGLYTDKPNSIIPGYFREYLSNFGIAESTARELIFLSLYNIQEEYYILGSDRIVRIIHYCRKNNIHNVNQVISEIFEKVEVPLTTKLTPGQAKLIDQLLEFKKFLMEYGDYDIVKNNKEMFDSLICNNTRCDKKLLNELTALKSEEKISECLEKFLLNGSTNHGVGTKKIPNLIDTEMSALNDRLDAALQQQTKILFDLTIAKTLRDNIDLLIQQQNESGTT